jgi:hypothetical protein
MEQSAAALPTATTLQMDLVLCLFQLALLGDEPRPRLERARAILRGLAADGRLSDEQKAWIDVIEKALASLPP